MTAACGLAQSFVQLLLARVGVGLGEAACTPPAHSLIGDYFPRARRATALSIYSMAIPGGMMTGLLCGGWIAHWWGWRVAFIAVGLPGVLLALLVRFSLREPLRGRYDAPTAIAAPTSAWRDVRELLGHAAILCIQIGGALHSVWGTGSSYWITPYFQRAHTMPTEALASWLAAGVFVGGVAGSLLSGRLADALGRRAQGWYFLVPAGWLLIGLPATVVMVSTESVKLALAMYVLQQAAVAAYAGPIYALTQFLVPPHLRALAVALHLFVLSVIGLGLGPVLIGAVSDHYQAELGSAGALRLGLLGAASAGVLALGPALLRRQKRETPLSSLETAQENNASPVFSGRGRES